MRIVSLLIIGATVSGLMACGGATSGTGDGTGTPGGNAGDTTKPGVGDPPSKNDPPTTVQGPGVVGESCPSPTSVIVPSGGTIARPVGSALRLQLVYQGSSIGITNVRGVDMILPPTSGPFTPGKIAGYWAEAKNASATTYTDSFQDPTVQEGFGGPGGGDFSNSTIARCTAKTFEVDVPNGASTSEVIVYGSPYGTNDGAVELARFSVK